MAVFGVHYIDDKRRTVFLYRYFGTISCKSIYGSEEASDLFGEGRIVVTLSICAIKNTSHFFDNMVVSSQAVAVWGKTRQMKGEFIMEIATVQDYELERYITNIMLDIGVPAHLKGYHYLRDAIMLSGRDMEVVSSVTKLLYPTIAKRFKTTDQKVERAIRNAIEVSWARGNVETFERMFGYSATSGKNRPTNSEYIARIADKVRLDFKAM